MPDLTLPADERSTEVVRRLADFLSGRNTQAYLVGGYIRDVLLNRYTQDVDIAVLGDATTIAKEAASYFNGKFVLLDDTKKVARVVLPHLYLDFSTIESNIDNDLIKRDFTVNAMASKLNPIGKTMTVIDPHNGQGDLAQKIIRATSDNIFVDDPLRLIRAVRFTSQLNFDIEEKTKSLIKHNASLLADIASERVCDEFCATMATDKAYSALRLMDELELMTTLFPELETCRGVAQPKEHHWDVFDHSVETVAAVDKLFIDIRTGQNGLSEIPWSDELDDHFNERISSGHKRITILKIAALLHDLGKPVTKGFTHDGRMRFIGHSQEGAQIAQNVMTRLRFSGREIKAVQRMIEQHMRPTQLSNNWEMPTRRAVYRYFRDTGDEAFDIMMLSLADHLAARGPMLDIEHWAYHIQVIKYIMSKHSQEQEVVKPPKLIDGHDLIELGIEPGPIMGTILETVREAQAVGEINSKQDAIDLAKRLLK